MADWGDNYSDDINAQPAALSNGNGMSNYYMPAGLQLIGALTQYSGYQTAAQATVNAGQSQAAMYQFKAAQDGINATEAIAASQAQEQETARSGALAQSHNLAMAAAGGTAGSPTVVNLVARQAGMTSYNMAMNLYNGESAARNLTIQQESDTMSAESATENAAAAAQADKMKGSAALISGAGGLYKNYGANFFTSGS